MSLLTFATYCTHTYSIDVYLSTSSPKESWMFSFVACAIRMLFHVYSCPAAGPARSLHTHSGRLQSWKYCSATFVRFVWTSVYVCCFRARYIYIFVHNSCFARAVIVLLICKTAKWLRYCEFYAYMKSNEVLWVNNFYWMNASNARCARNPLA